MWDQAHRKRGLAADVSEIEVAPCKADNCAVQLHTVNRQAKAAAKVDGQRSASQPHHQHASMLALLLPPLQYWVRCTTFAHVDAK